METLLVTGAVAIVFGLFVVKIGRMLFSITGIIVVLALFYFGLLPAAISLTATVAKSAATTVASAVRDNHTP